MNQHERSVKMSRTVIYVNEIEHHGPACLFVRCEDIAQICEQRCEWPAEVVNARTIPGSDPIPKEEGWGRDPWS